MLRNGKIKSLWLFQVAADFAAVSAAYYTTMLLRFHSEWGDRFFSSVNQALGVRMSGSLGGELESFYISSAPRIILLIFGTLVVFYALQDLYPERRFLRRRPATWSMILGNAGALALFYAYFYLERNVFHPRSFFATVMVLNVFYGVTFRVLMENLMEYGRSHRDMDVHRAILFGSDSEADFIQQLIAQYHPHGILTIVRREFNTSTSFDEQLAEIETQARQLKADLIISAEKRLSLAEIMELIEMTDKIGIPVKVLSDKLSVLPNEARLPVDMIRGKPLVHFETQPGGKRDGRWSKVFPVVLGFLVLLPFLPIMGLIALLIRLTSRGHAIFVQERMGVNRQPFMMYKFRTMYDRSDEIQAQVEEFNDAEGALFKIRKDPRITPLGRFLRRFSLDELPQLFNVLRGQMAIVGPRPLPRRDFENYYEKWHYSRHSGIDLLVAGVRQERPRFPQHVHSRRLLPSEPELGTGSEDCPADCLGCLVREGRLLRALQRRIAGHSSSMKRFICSSAARLLPAIGTCTETYAHRGR